MQGWVTTQLARVDRWQLPTGGFGWWFLAGVPMTQPWLTVHTTHVLVRAKARGISLPAGVLDKALACCKVIEKHVGQIGETSKVAILAKALWVRALAASEPAATLQKEVVDLLARMGGVDGKHSNLESVSFLLMAAKLCNESSTPTVLLQHLANRAHETAETATFATSCKLPLILPLIVNVELSLTSSLELNHHTPESGANSNPGRGDNPALDPLLNYTLADAQMATTTLPS